MNATAPTARALLVFLDARADVRSPVVGAVYAGLAERVRRGEFDAREEAAWAGER